MSLSSLNFHPVPGLPLVRPGDDLPALIGAALRSAGHELRDGDLLAVAQKIVSKAEGRLVRLADVQASPEAFELAERTDKDPRLVELILGESNGVVRVGRNVVIVEHKLGLVLANAGIDRSNVTGPELAEADDPEADNASSTGDGDDTVLLLPKDPDASAARLRDRLRQEFGANCAVMITDSIGRPWRLGTTGTAIGCAGIDALVDLRGRPDLFGRRLQVSEVAVADSLAAAAVLVMGEGDEGVPLVLVRGFPAGDSTQTASAVLRPRDEDLFR